MVFDKKYKRIFWKFYIRLLVKTKTALSSHLRQQCGFALFCCLAEKEGFEPRMNVIIKNETLLFQDIIKIIIHFVCNFCLLISENMLIYLLQHIWRRVSHAFHCILVRYVQL